MQNVNYLTCLALFTLLKTNEAKTFLVVIVNKVEQSLTSECVSTFLVVLSLNPHGLLHLL